MLSKRDKRLNKGGVTESWEQGGERTGSLEEKRRWRVDEQAPGLFSKHLANVHGSSEGPPAIREKICIVNEAETLR